MLCRAHHQETIGDGRRAHADLTHLVPGQFFIHRARPGDDHLAVLAREIDAAIGGDRRGREGAAATVEPLAVDLFAGPGVIRRQAAVIGAGVQVITVDDGCGDVGAPLVLALGNRRAGLGTLGQ